MLNSNKTPRQGICTIYVGPPAPVWISEGAPPWARSRMELKCQGKISRPGKHPRSRWEFSQKNGEQERTTRGNQSFQKLIPFLYFSGLLIYFLLYIGMKTESCGVSRPDPCQNQVLHIKLYKGLRGFTSSSGHEACWHFMAPSDNGQSTRKHIFQGWIFLNQEPPSEGTR